MKCAEVQDLLHAYVDGELDLVRNLEVERHLLECAACAEAVRKHQTLRAALGDPSLYHRPPPDLARRVRSSLRREGGMRTRSPVARRWLPTAAAVVLGVLAAWAVGRGFREPSSEDLLAREVVSDHVRSLMLMPGHLLDVPSTDQHTVKPWFNGHVDFSPVVKDLTKQGFELAGGRLDYLDDRPVAALVYRRRQHVINLFTWPDTAAPDVPPQALTRQGYHLIHWSEKGLTFWAISDLNEQELQEFVALIRG